MRLDEELAHAALAPGSLPFLQFTLDELFNARDEATKEKIVLCCGNVKSVASVNDQMTVDNNRAFVQVINDVST